jgi:hypothetical protein
VAVTDQTSIMLKFIGYSAAGALTIVSAITNARFGWTLGASPLDKATYVATSVETSRASVRRSGTAEIEP